MFKIIKLDPTSGISKTLDFKEFIFPAGEVSVKLNAKDYAYKALSLPNLIVARLQNSDDLLKLAMLKDALQRFDTNPINLFLPYVPYARQDRVCDTGESYSIAVLARFVASLGFNKVIIADPHSEVTPATFETLGVKLTVLKQLDILNKATNFIPVLMRSVMVSPDAGSNKKTADVAGWLAQENFIRADKLRDLSNGQIKETVVYADDLNGKDVVIVDDLCERGGTFILLAQALKKKNAGRVILYVTHGVFGGKNEIDKTLANLCNGGIDEIWTTSSYYDTGTLAPFMLAFPLTVLDIEKIAYAADKI